MVAAMPPAAKPVHPLLSPYLLMLLPPLFWAGNAVVGRAAVGEIPPFSLSFWRWVLALIILLPFGLPRILAQRQGLAGRWRLVAVLAATSVFAYNTLLYLALETTTAINATLVGTSLPIAIIALSWVLLGERLKIGQWVGVAVSLAGVALVISRGDSQVLLGLELRQGDLIMLAATVSWAVYSVLLRRLPPGLDPLGLLTLLVAIGTVMLVPLFLWDLAIGATFDVNTLTVSIIVFVALFPSVLAYFFWNHGVAAIGASAAGQYTYLVPVLTAGLAVVALDERFHWFHAAGLALILSGIWLSTLWGARSKRPE